MSVAPSGLFPSDRERQIGSLVAGIWALLTALQIIVIVIIIITIIIIIIIIII